MKQTPALTRLKAETSLLPQKDPTVQQRGFRAMGSLTFRGESSQVHMVAPSAPPPSPPLSPPPPPPPLPSDSRGALESSTSSSDVSIRLRSTERSSVLEEVLGSGVLGFRGFRVQGGQGLGGLEMSGVTAGVEGSRLWRSALGCTSGCEMCE